jgi:hypothetical protein
MRMRWKLPLWVRAAIAILFSFVNAVRADNLYVSNAASGVISQIAPGGVVSPYSSGFNSPEGVGFDNIGNLYVANPGTGALVKVAPGGGSASNLAFDFNGMIGLALDAGGNIYVGEVNTKTIAEFSPAGARSTFASVPGSTFLESLAFDHNGNLFAADNNGAVFKITPDGNVTNFGNTGRAAAGLAVDHNGDVFVSDPGASEIYEFTPGGSMSGYASVVGVLGLTFDNNGDLFGVTQYNNSVVEIGPGGGPITTYATGFSEPTFIANPSYSVFVPEPAALGLLSIGGTCLMARRRKRI